MGFPTPVFKTGAFNHSATDPMSAGSYHRDVFHGLAIVLSLRQVGAGKQLFSGLSGDSDLVEQIGVTIQ